MWFLLSIILIVLGVFILALRGFFGIFPDNWEWVGIVLAGVGIAAGVPSILQIALGKPKLQVVFDRQAHESDRSLIVFLKNAPLDNPDLKKKSVWRKLGVKRDTIESLTVSFRISEVGTRKLLIPIKQARIYSDAIGDNGTWRTTLPPTISLETCVMVAIWDKNKMKALIPPDRTKPIDELGRGQYEIQLIISADGAPYLYARQFIVGTTADDLDWVKPIPHK